MTTALEKPPPALAAQAAPFLVWPVSRREFYMAIWASLLLPIAWGLVIYGERVLIILVASVVAATFTHSFLKRGLRWPRAQCLVYAHSLAATMLLVALARPTWPAWIVAGVALMLPAVLALVGGPGKERVQIAVAAVLLIQYVFLPLMAGHTYTDKPDAILARDRLFMGDIRDQHAAPPGSRERWPESRELGGNDALTVHPPAVAVAAALNEMSTVLVIHPLDQGHIAPAAKGDLADVLRDYFVYQLVPMDRFLLGAAPNRIGTACLWGIAAAGLFLAYRHILRARSVVLFLFAFTLTSIAGMFTPGTLHAVGLQGVLHAIALFPSEMIVLLVFLVLSGDAVFASVFLLAMPGTEPLTPRGRRIFLVIAAVLAAGLHRLDPEAPAATLILCLLTPLARYFDRLFAARSWLPAR